MLMEFRFISIKRLSYLQTQYEKFQSIKRLLFTNTNHEKFPVHTSWSYLLHRIAVNANPLSPTLKGMLYLF